MSPRLSLIDFHAICSLQRRMLLNSCGRERQRGSGRSGQEPWLAEKAGQAQRKDIGGRTGWSARKNSDANRVKLLAIHSSPGTASARTGGGVPNAFRLHPEIQTHSRWREHWRSWSSFENTIGGRDRDRTGDPCLQSRRGKTLKALSGVVYTENWRNSCSL